MGALALGATRHSSTPPEHHLAIPSVAAQLPACAAHQMVMPVKAIMYSMKYTAQKRWTCPGWEVRQGSSGFSWAG